MINFKELKNKVFQEILKAKDLKILNDIYIFWLGRKGKINDLFKEMKKQTEKERAKFGKEINELKNYIERELEKKRGEIKYIIYREEIEKEKIDVTRPGAKIPKGHLHPISIVRQNIEEIFNSMGFEVAEGPDIETEYYNFDALNIPPEHPAREMWDTFWLKDGKNSKFKIQNSKFQSKNHKFLLRTHTSPVQIRYMQTHQPPIRIIAPGKVFRYEATDVSHDIEFFQIEGLMIDKCISLANFKAIIEDFFSRFFGERIKTRLRPSYFPFVEPGFEVDITCTSCLKSKIKNPRSRASSLGKQKSKINCSVCKGTGWLEIAGAGMVHPNVLKVGGINPQEWQGFAFGMGLDRLTMVKYKINDIRLFHSGDLRFLKQF